MCKQFRKIISVLLLCALCVIQTGLFSAYADPATEAQPETDGAAQLPGNGDTQDPQENASAGSVASSALSWPELNADIKAGSAIVMDADTRQILWGKDIHAKRYPASVTKILTALIVIDRCSMDEQVTFSASAVNNLESGAVTIGTVPGDVLSVKDCLYALLLKSANEVANALAEHVSGSVSSFAELMNLYASELGCVDSDFRNPSGLTDPDHVTSAYDMALIACACMNNKDFMYLESEPTRKLAGTVNYPDGLTVTIGHKMRKEGEYYDPRVTAGKTGYTSAAGNTLVTMAEDHGRRVVIVVLKDTSPSHYTDTAALINYGLENFELLRPTAAVLEETFGLEKQLTEKGIIEPSDETAGTKNSLSFSGDPLIAVPLGGGLKDLKLNLDGKVFAGTAEDESASPEVPEKAVAKLTLSCLDSNGRTVYVLNDRTEPVTENSEVSLTAGGKQDSGAPDTDIAEKKGFGIAGWIVTILLLTAAGYVSLMYFRRRAAQKRREERRRKRLERMNRIGAKAEAAGGHRRKSRPAPAAERAENVSRRLTELAGNDKEEHPSALHDGNGPDALHSLKDPADHLRINRSGFPAENGRQTVMPPAENDRQAAPSLEENSGEAASFFTKGDGNA